MKNMEYLVIIILISSLALSIATFNPYLIMLCAALSFTALFAYFLRDELDAMVFKKTNLVQVIDGFELEADRSTATRRTASGFTATASAVLFGPSDHEIKRENIESIIAHSNAPFKFVIHAERMNTSKIIDKLKTERRIKEIYISKAKNGDSAKVKALEREAELLEREINAISSGAIPIKVSSYLFTSAFAEGKFAARERARAQIRELSGEFSALLGARFEPVSGNELVRLLKFESTCVT